jgi:c-di-GMP-binding flagellar brake protein YcgR
MNKPDENNPSKPSPSSQPPRIRPVVEDPRSTYRVARGLGTPLEAVVITAEGRTLSGECLDLSLCGAGISLPRMKDMDFVEGTRITVRIRHLSRPRAIEANATVQSVALIGSTVRYGLRFEDPALVAEQIDSFYARWFNRRRHVRVMPDFSTRIEGLLRSTAGGLRARLHDVSMGGMSFVVPLVQARKLEAKAKLDVTLTLPNSPHPIVCRARLVCVKPYTRHALVCIEFEPTGGIDRYSAALQAYIAERQRSINRFNQGGGSRKAG